MSWWFLNYFIQPITMFLRYNRQTSNTQLFVIVIIPSDKVYKEPIK